jgi:peptidoglycan/LPS O-acetylase OafA/YrhL
VLWIVVGHCWLVFGGLTLGPGPLKYIFTAFYFGVDLLFIVSGFVLFLPAVLHDGSLGDLRSYALRRAARIVPAFYIAALLSYFVARSLGTVRGGAGAWISHLFFVHQFAHPIKDIGFGVDGAMWTMTVEAIFYISLPFVAGWYARHPLLGLGLAFYIAQMWHVLTTKLDGILSLMGISWAGAGPAKFRMAYAFPSYAAHFALGMTGAWLFVRMKQHFTEAERRPLALASASAAIIGLLGLAYLQGWNTERNIRGPYDNWINTFPRAVLFATLILAFALLPAEAQWPLRNRVSRMLGTISYGVYLVHVPMIALVRPALGLRKGTTNITDVFLLAVVVVPLSISIGITSYALLEEPMRRWARRRTMAQSSASGLSPRSAALAHAAVAALYHSQ